MSNKLLPQTQAFEQQAFDQIGLPRIEKKRSFSNSWKWEFPPCDIEIFNKDYHV